MGSSPTTGTNVKDVFPDEITGPEGQDAQISTTPSRDEPAFTIEKFAEADSEPGI